MFGDFGYTKYQNNRFLGVFRLKFCFKTFETCSLLYVSVLKCNILAIILFEYLLSDPSAKRGAQIVQKAKKFQECTGPLPLTSRDYGTPSGVILIQQCFKRHSYIAANKLCIRFLKAHFFLVFSPV